MPRYKVTGPVPVAVGDDVHDVGATFTASEEAVEDAVTHGLVEPVDKRRKAEEQ